MSDRTTDGGTEEVFTNAADYAQRYDMRTAAAWVLGHARRTGVPKLPDELSGRKTDECTDEEKVRILAAAQAAGLKLYPFKSGTRTLARTQRTLGFLRSISFETMLDVGSGRGAFLIPFMNAFPWVRVTSADILSHRVDFLNELADGGLGALNAVCANICDQPFPDDSFDVVTLLEVLEHIPDVERAVASAVRMAKQYVVVTVPSKPDDNPEHIHLLTRERLTELFAAAGCTKLHFDGVQGHTFLTAAVGR